MEGGGLSEEEEESFGHGEGEGEEEEEGDEEEKPLSEEEEEEEKQVRRRAGAACLVSPPLLVRHFTSAGLSPPGAGRVSPDGGDAEGGPLPPLQNWQRPGARLREV